MKLELDIAELRLIGEMFPTIITQGRQIMSQFSDFAGRMQAKLDEIGASLTGISGDTQTLLDLIKQLQNSRQFTPEDQATVDKLEAVATGLASRAKAMDDQLPQAAVFDQGSPVAVNAPAAQVSAAGHHDSEAENIQNAEARRQAALKQRGS